MNQEALAYLLLNLSLFKKWRRLEDGVGKEARRQYPGRNSRVCELLAINIHHLATPQRDTHGLERGSAALRENPVLDFLRAGRPVIRLLGQAGEHQLVNIIGNFIINAKFLEALIHGYRRPGHHLHIDITRVKGWLAGHQVVKCGPEGIDIIRSARHLAIHLLRAHEEQRAAHRMFH